MSRIIRSATIATLLLCSWPIASPADDRFADAFSIMIDHFDPDHEVGLGTRSDEFRFVDMVLERARNDVPELHGVNRRFGEMRVGRTSTAPFRTLCLVDPASKHGDYQSVPYDSMMALTSRLLDGCKHSRYTHEWVTEGEASLLYIDREYGIFDMCRTWMARSTCGNGEGLGWLCSEGIATIAHCETNYLSRRKSSLLLMFNTAVDLEYRARTIQSHPLHDSIFGDYRLVPFRDILIGDGDTIDVLDWVGYEGFHGIALEFSHGWSDCPSGCIDRHHWIVAYENLHPEDPERWELVGGLVDESGDELSEEARARLRSRKYR